MTIVFWIIVSLLTLLVVGSLLRPLLRSTTVPAGGQQEAELDVYRQQFAELEQDRNNQILTDEQYQRDKRELERRVLEEADQPVVKPVAVRRTLNTKAVAMVLALTIPTVSALLYWKLGNQAAIEHPAVSVMSGQGDGEPHLATGGLDALADRLKQRLEQNPADGVGWALLARSYAELGRHAEAVPIYEKAMALIPDDAQLLADYADALGVLHGRRLEGKPEALIKQALKIDPSNVKALMLAGTVAFDRKDFAQAATYWEQARANLPPDVEGEVAQGLAGGIEEARALAGGGGMPVASAAQASPAKAGQPGRAITGTVTLAANVAGKGSPADTLFVFAKAVDGPPMPVAIVRATKGDLPFSFRLDDSNSPMPARKLSEAGTVVIVARLSKSGEATPKSGDLQGMSQPVMPGAKDVAVTIDREIP
jgi:cytochrome c-type biogenesis protein CcmH